jgi:phosphatidate cytidylyltransferase
MTLISSLALHEYYRLARTRGAKPQIVTGLMFGVCVSAVFMYEKLQYIILGVAARWGWAVPLPTMAQWFLILALVFVPAILLVELFRNKGTALMNVAVTVFGVFYIPFFLGSFIGLRELFVPADFPVFLYFDVHGIDIPAGIVEKVYAWGGYTVIAVFASIWVCDSAAYFAGRAWGKHKLFPRVSPNKTWEGAGAGFLAAVLAFIAAKEIALPYMTMSSAIVCGCIVGVFGQLGDMVESLLKRDAGVKDSSGLIPGHGGVMDRFDSLILVAPIIFLYLDFIVF